MNLVYYEQLKPFMMEQINYWYVPGPLYDHIQKYAIVIVAPLKCKRGYPLRIKRPFDTIDIYKPL